MISSLSRISVLLVMTAFCAVIASASDDPRPAKKTGETKRKIAAIVTTYFPNSHAGVLVDKFIRGFPTDEGLIPPRTEIASLYIDQIHAHDIGRQTAHAYGIPIYESIRATLTLGGDKLAVDAVLLIGEHGDYPRTALGQEMLPRRYFFEQIVGVIGEAGRPIPIFNDKHLSHRWDHARWMYETAKVMGIPLWAGSALPVVWRKPNWEHPAGEPIDQALVIGFHMVERYGFHALEVLQSNVERRRGGETGVRSVQCLSGKEVWRVPFPETRIRHSIFLAVDDGHLVAVGGFTHEVVTKKADGTESKRLQTWYEVMCFGAGDGELRWRVDHSNNAAGSGGDHGEQVHHPVLRDGVLFVEPVAYHLDSGARWNPDGGDKPWFLGARRGCGTFSASASCLYFRNHNPMAMTIGSGAKQTKITEVSRPGCWISILPVGGMVLLPEASADGCPCCCCSPASSGRIRRTGTAAPR